MGNGTFLYFLKNFFLIFPEMELFSLKNKKFQKGTFQAQKIKKASLKKFLTFFQKKPKNQNFLYFSKKSYE